MKLSKAAILTKRDRVNSEELLSMQILLQADQIKRYGSGLYGKNHFLVRAQMKIENIIREVLDEYDCIEVSVPIIQPKTIWESSGRWSAYADSGELFVCHTSNGDFCVAPTAEEAMIVFVRDSLKSYKDLPVNLYQINTKARNETRASGGLLRSKEFTMMDSYSFGDSEESMKREYERMKQVYAEICRRLGLTVIPVSAFSASIGGNYSEEYMVLSKKGGDTILVNKSNTQGFNKEIQELPNASDYLAQFGIKDLSGFTEKRCIELGHVFQLKQKYSTPLRGTFKDANNHDVPYYMGCYGIGTSRLVNLLCEENCDEDGLYWPEQIAPYQLMIVYKNDKEELAHRLYDDLQMSHISVVLDDRIGVRIGASIKDWKLFGIPWLLIIGDRCDGEHFELESRKDGSKYYMSKEQLFDYFR